MTTDRFLLTAGVSFLLGTPFISLGIGLLFGLCEFPSEETCILHNKSYAIYQTDNCDNISDLKYYNLIYELIQSGSENIVNACSGVNNIMEYKCCINTGTSRQNCPSIKLDYHKNECNLLISDNLNQYDSMVVGSTYPCWNNNGILSLNSKIITNENTYFSLIAIGAILYLLGIIYILIYTIKYCIKHRFYKAIQPVLELDRV